MNTELKSALICSALVILLGMAPAPIFAQDCWEPLYTTTNLANHLISIEPWPGDPNPPASPVITTSDVSLVVHSDYAEVIANVRRTNVYVNAIAAARFENTFPDGSPLDLGIFKYGGWLRCPAIPTQDIAVVENAQNAHMMIQMWDGDNRVWQADKYAIEATMMWALCAWETNSYGKLFLYTSTNDNLQLVDTGLSLPVDTNWHHIEFVADFVNRKFISIRADEAIADVSHIRIAHVLRTNWGPELLYHITQESGSAYPGPDYSKVFSWTMEYRDLEFSRFRSCNSGTLQISNASTNVNEDVGSVILTVMRAEGSNGVAGVSYAAADGTAIAGTDYVATSGALNWADGDSANKTIKVPIMNRAGTQGSRIFSVGLVGAAGASLGSPTSITVTIEDVLTPPAAPTGLAASDGTYTDKVRITWNSVNDATMYCIFRHVSNVSSAAEQIGIVGLTTYDDMDAVAGATHYYWVKARNSAGTSDFSAMDYGIRASLFSAADFDGDGKADPAIHRVGVGWTIWLSTIDYTQVGPYLDTVNTGAVSPADFDGDGKADPALYSDGAGWWVNFSSQDYDLSGPYLPAPMSGCMMAGDVDGDGLADPALYLPFEGWYIWPSMLDYAVGGPYLIGEVGATPVLADFDGDGKADPAIYRPSDGWYIWPSSMNHAMEGPFLIGAEGYSAHAADFDGDGLADPALYRDATGYLYVWLSGNDYTLTEAGTFSAP